MLVVTGRAACSWEVALGSLVWRALGRLDEHRGRRALPWQPCREGTPWSLLFLLQVGSSPAMPWTSLERLRSRSGYTGSSWTRGSTSSTTTQAVGARKPWRDNIWVSLSVPGRHVPGEQRPAAFLRRCGRYKDSAGLRLAREVSEQSRRHHRGGLGEQPEGHLWSQGPAASHMIQQYAACREVQPLSACALLRCRA